MSSGSRRTLEAWEGWMLQARLEKIEGEEWGVAEEERSKICWRNRENSSGGEGEEETAAGTGTGRVQVEHAF